MMSNDTLTNQALQQNRLEASCPNTSSEAWLRATSIEIKNIASLLKGIHDLLQKMDHELQSSVTNAERGLKESRSNASPKRGR